MYFIFQDPPVVQNRDDTFRTKKSQRILKCNASGVPDIYTFSAWQHHTYNHSFIRELDGDTNGTLTLPELKTTDHLYEDSGIYICNVSNGISGEEEKLWQIGQIRAIVEGILNSVFSFDTYTENRAFVIPQQAK